MTRRRFAWIALVAACAPAGFEPSSRVDSLRVLAVQADRPFAAPGEDVALTALVVDPEGGGRPVALSFATCLNPGSGEIRDCAAELGPMRELAVGADGTATFGVRVPDDALAGLSVPVGSVGVVFAACAGSFVDRPRAPGAPIGCLDASGRLSSRDGFVWGEKRIAVVPVFRNENPAIDRVDFDLGGSEPDIGLVPCPRGAEAKSCPADRLHRFDVYPAKGAAETYPDPVHPGATLTEDLVLFFFATQGTLADEVVRTADPDGLGQRFTTSYAPTDIDPSKPIDFWFVLRDDRGGTSFAHRTATLR